MSMTDSAVLAMQALPHYIREQMKTPTRKSYLLSEIRKRGRETYNNGGENVEWRPEMRRNDIHWGKGNPNVVSFPQINFNTKAVVNYKTAWMGLSYSEIQMLALKDKAASFFNKVKMDGGRLAEDFPMRFSPHLFRDGTGTDKIEGIESFGSYSAAADDSTGPAAGQPIGLPNDTYAGLSTTLGSIGDWSGNWPICGTDPDACDYEYSYWSPIIGDYNDDGLVVDSTTESAGWDDCWIYAMRYVVTHSGVLNGVAPDVWIIDPDLLRRAENSLKKQQQFFLDDGVKELDAGIRVLKYEGTRYATEWGVPAGCVYGFTFDKFELKCMWDNFIHMDNDKDIITGDTLWKVCWHGTPWFQSPIFFPMLKGISALGT